MWAQQIVNGLTIGVVYALIGMGFSMVWATARTLNFATGSVYTLGSYIVFVIFTLLASGNAAGIVPVVLLSLPVSAVVGGLLGYVLERGVFRPLRHSELAPLFCSLGFGIALENVYVFLFGARPAAANLSGARSFFSLGPVSITSTQIVVLLGSIVIMILLQLLLTRSSLGRAMRATAWDRTAARLMGINVNGILALVFIITSAIGTLTGSFIGLFYGIMDPYMGLSASIKGLAAAIFGGFGNIPGAVAGGLIIGVMEAVGSMLTTSGNWQDVFAYLILILVIVFRPQGLFPERAQEGA